MLFLSSRISRKDRSIPPRELHPILLKLLSALTITLGILIRLTARISRWMDQQWPLLRQQRTKQ